MPSFRFKFVNFFTKMLTLMIWVLSLPSIFINKHQYQGITLLTTENMNLLDEGRWCIVFNKENALKCREYVDCKIGLVYVTSYNSAALAASFQPIEYSEVIYFEQGKISSKFGERQLTTNLKTSLVLDYFMFFFLKNLQFTFSSAGLKSLFFVLKNWIEESLVERPFY